MHVNPLSWIRRRHLGQMLILTLPLVGMGFCALSFATMADEWWERCKPLLLETPKACENASDLTGIILAVLGSSILGVLGLWWIWFGGRRTTAPRAEHERH